MLTTILLDGAPQGGGLSGILMIVAMIVVFYFFMIRPQSKKQKEIRQARDAMAKGDRVVTIGGIHGKIQSIQDQIVMIEIAPGVQIKVDKNALNPAGQQAEKLPENQK